ncbi:SDR family NAD(P)-dependent oxidoreductase [Aestuariivivens marinum]|uniref:SDR family NAD(P)-dependent oxidoreductase n=1 Tax=Aestuariivivens marinum TaxID=2913555 RepID=UPI001F577485|nr:SDR family oxidoreductase [Aestuariivivens marinum]
MSNPFTLINKTILITGASSGIGRATAILCAEMGATLFITGRTEAKLNETFTNLSGTGHQKIVLDFEIEDAITRLVAAIDQLDGIVHSAGMLDSTPIKFVNSTKLSKVMKLNFEVPYKITHQLVKERKIAKNGAIVYVSSLAGIGVGIVGNFAYSASKGAISSSIKVMALELALRKIRVNTVCPGMVRTEMLDTHSPVSKEQLAKDEKEHYPLGYGTPEQVANAIVFLLSDASSWITGTNLVIDGGASIH